MAYPSRSTLSPDTVVYSLSVLFFISSLLHTHAQLVSHDNPSAPETTTEPLVIITYTRANALLDGRVHGASIFSIFRSERHNRAVGDGITRAIANRLSLRG